ncbi:MAG: Calx-beta domain-containing protein [Planctomycetota bacterium]|jgi:hypothetical protein
MRRNIVYLTSFVLLLGLVSSASAVGSKVDFGGAGTLGDDDPPDAIGTWTQWAATSGSMTIDGITFQLSNGNLNNGPKLRYWESSGDSLTKDAVSEEDPGSGGWYQIQITGLTEGVEYIMRSYHNNAWEPGSFPSGSVSMKLNGTEVDTCTVSNQQPYTNAGVCEHTFTAGSGSDTFKWDFGQTAWFNGFILQPTAPSVQFKSAASGDLETVSPAELTVILSSAEEGQTYTVDYAVIGGTATKGDDYTLTEPGTLTFIPGDTSETIIIDIIDDGLDEDDETIVVELSNPTGPGALLGGITEHTYTIRDPRPQVAFDANTTRNTEYAGLANIPVSLSWPPIETVTVDYEVTGGTATGGGVDYTLEPGILTFNPGESTKSIGMVIINDGIDEEHETVVITLSNPAHAHLGSRSVHTSTIIGPNTVHFRMDIALPVWTGTEQVPDWEGVPIPETLKEGWIPWCAGRWGDMYGHGTTAVEDIAGTGVSTMTSTVYGGLTAVKVCGMCMPSLNGGDPYGSPIYDPICNSWMQVEDHPENPSGDIIMALYNLPAGEYELYSYHNNFECHRLDETPDGTPACCDLTGIPQPDMPSITALSLSGLLERYSDYEWWPRWLDPRSEFINCKPQAWWDHPVGSIVGDNVTMTEGAYNVPIQQVTQDSQLVPSLIKFRTDSSAVFIVYESGCCVPDGIRPDRVGGRAILNAFELKLTEPGGPMPACWDWPTQCHGDTDNTDDVKGSDFLTLKNSWYKVYGVDPEYDPCADFDRNGEVKGSDFLILKNNWYQIVDPNCPTGGTWPPQP